MFHLLHCMYMCMYVCMIVSVCLWFEGLDSLEGLGVVYLTGGHEHGSLAQWTFATHLAHNIHTYIQLLKTIVTNTYMHIIQLVPTRDKHMKHA